VTAVAVWSYAIALTDDEPMSIASTSGPLDPGTTWVMLKRSSGRAS